MLEKPAINDDLLISSLNEEYGKAIRSISFLPIGADENTAVYKTEASDHTSYFVKLRRGESSEAAVLVPTFLAESGIKQVIPAIRTHTGALRHELDASWVMTLHPFVEGHHGYAQKMSPTHWVDFGAALKYLHTTNFPAKIIEGISREEFSSRWHDELRTYMVRIERELFVDPVAVELAAFLTSKRNESIRLIEKLEESVHPLLHQAPEYVLCHADIHCWNLLIDDRTEDLHIVDWDTLIFAPKERDLMFTGGGLADSGYTPAQEAEMFFRGYGQTAIDNNAITYYRCVRIVEDLVVYCRQVFLSKVGGEDRKQAVVNVRSNFRPNGTIAMAIGSL
jgi:spectinomycin phosphotransferase